MDYLCPSSSIMAMHPVIWQKGDIGDTKTFHSFSVNPEAVGVYCENRTKLSKGTLKMKTALI